MNCTEHRLAYKKQWDVKYTKQNSYETLNLYIFTHCWQFHFDSAFIEALPIIKVKQTNCKQCIHYTVYFTHYTMYHNQGSVDQKEAKDEDLHEKQCTVMWFWFDIENETKLGSLSGGSNMSWHWPYINCFVYT